MLTEGRAAPRGVEVRSQFNDDCDVDWFCGRITIRKGIIIRQKGNNTKYKATSNMLAALYYMIELV